MTSTTDASIRLSVHYLRAGFDASGKLIAFHHRKACDEVTAFQDPVRFKRQKGRDGIAFNGLDAPYYDIPNRLGEAVPRESGLRTSSLRGIAHLTNIFAIELFMDELARKRAVDPATFRRDLVKGNPRAVAIIDHVSRMAEWGKKRDGSALGFTYMNYSGTQIALVAEVEDRPQYRSRCGCRKSGWRSIPALRSSPTTCRADGKQRRLRPRLCALGTHHDRRRRGAGVELLRLPCAAHERDPGDLRRGGPDQQPPDRRRPDGDAAGRAGDRQCGRGDHRRAPAANADDGRSREAGARVRVTCGKEVEGIALRCL